MNTYLISGGTYSARESKMLGIISENMDLRPNHPDIEFVELEDGKKNISIDQVRSASEYFFIKPVVSDKKIVCIKEAQFLSVEAQNSLLKVLEEPPSYGIFILTVNNKKNVLPTILSRCASIEVADSSNIDFNGADHNKNADALIKLIRSDLGFRIDWTTTEKDNLKDDGYFKLLSESWESVLRDIMVCKLGSSNIMNSFQEIDIAKIASFNGIDESGMIITASHAGSHGCSGAESVIFNIRKLHKVKQAVLNSNVNPSLAIESFLVSLPQIKIKI